MTDQEKTIVPFFGLVEYILYLSSFPYMYYLNCHPPTCCRRRLLSSSFVIVIFSIVIPYPSNRLHSIDGYSLPHSYSIQSLLVVAVVAVVLFPLPEEMQHASTPAFSSLPKSTLRLKSCVLGGTSNAGFFSKKFTGLRATLMTSQGMTGKSSMRGIYFKRKKQSSIIVLCEKEC